MLSCGQGICAAHTDLKAMFHLQRSSCQCQCSGFPRRRLPSPLMPPLRSCGPNVPCQEESHSFSQHGGVFGLNELWWDCLLSCGAAVEVYGLYRAGSGGEDEDGGLSPV